MPAFMGDTMDFEPVPSAVDSKPIATTPCDQAASSPSSRLSRNSPSSSYGPGDMDKRESGCCHGTTETGADRVTISQIKRNELFEVLQDPHQTLEGFCRTLRTHCEHMKKMEKMASTSDAEQENVTEVEAQQDVDQIDVVVKALQERKKEIIEREQVSTLCAKFVDIQGEKIKKAFQAERELSGKDIADIQNSDLPQAATDQEPSSGEAQSSPATSASSTLTPTSESASTVSPSGQSCSKMYDIPANGHFPSAMGDGDPSAHYHSLSNGRAASVLDFQQQQQHAGASTLSQPNLGCIVTSMGQRSMPQPADHLPSLSFSNNGVPIRPHGVSADIPTPWVSTESLQAADLNSTLSGSGLQLGHTLVNSRSMPSLNGSPMHSFAEADSSKKRKKPKDKKRQMFSQAATKILKEWLHGNLSNPYPTEDEKKRMSRDTGLTILQVNNWFINARRRQVQPLVDKVNRGVRDGAQLETTCKSRRRSSSDKISETGTAATEDQSTFKPVAMHPNDDRSYTAMLSFDSQDSPPKEAQGMMQAQMATCWAPENYAVGPYPATRSSSGADFTGQVPFPFGPVYQANMQQGLPTTSHPATLPSPPPTATAGATFPRLGESQTPGPGVPYPFSGPNYMMMSGGNLIPADQHAMLSMTTAAGSTMPLPAQDLHTLWSSNGPRHLAHPHMGNIAATSVLQK